MNKNKTFNEIINQLSEHINSDIHRHNRISAGLNCNLISNSSNIHRVSQGVKFNIALSDNVINKAIKIYDETSLVDI